MSKVDVVVRVRPHIRDVDGAAAYEAAQLEKLEPSRFQCGARARPDENVVHVKAAARKVDLRAPFDRVFGPSAEQEDVYRHVRESVLGDKCETCPPACSAAVRKGHLDISSLPLRDA